jgi:CHAT domain-containing protein
MIATSGPAAAIPLGVLLMAPPTEGSFQSQVWLGRARAMSYLPEPADLVRLRRAAQQQAGRQLLAFGAPCTGALAGAACNASADATPTPGGSLAALPAEFLLMRSSPDRARSVDGAALAALPALPAARRELAQLGALYPRRARVMLGEEATEAAVRATAVPPGAVVAFATHGLSAGTFGLDEPALVLTPPVLSSPSNDGLLTASEVRKLRFPDAFVILSACNTAGIRSVETLDPYVGFARAFFDAGARALLVSQFEVPDEAAARLSTGLLGRLAKAPRLDRAEALRQTIDSLLADPEAAALHHPRAWGTMILVGSPD